MSNVEYEWINSFFGDECVDSVIGRNDNGESLIWSGSSSIEKLLLNFVMSNIWLKYKRKKDKNNNIQKKTRKKDKN